MSMKNPLTPAGIEPATLTTVLPRSPVIGRKKLEITMYSGGFTYKDNNLQKNVEIHTGGSYIRHRSLITLL